MSLAASSDRLIRTFPGDTSRWMTSCSCAKASASATSATIEIARSRVGGLGPRASAPVFIPGTSSITMNGRGTAPASKTATISGCARPAHELRFAAELAQAAEVGGQRLGENLDRDAPFEQLVARAVDRRHAARADPALEAIAPAKELGALPGRCPSSGATVSPERSP